MAKVNRYVEGWRAGYLAGYQESSEIMVDQQNIIGQLSEDLRCAAIEKKFLERRLAKALQKKSG